jgi:spore coat polysaccharide biosynthesis protein SpsF
VDGRVIVAGIIQARMGSTRLPGKVLLPLGGQPLLDLMTSRLARSTQLTTLCVATSRLPSDDAIADWAASRGLMVFRGAEDDVLGRYAAAAERLAADVIVRLTGDCPLICADVTDRVIRAFLDAAPPVEYATNCLRRTYPRGLDTEVFPRATVDRAAAEGHSSADREHVTHFIRQHPDRFRQLSIEDPEDNSALRWTVDTIEDYTLVSSMVAALGPSRAVTSSYADLIALSRHHPEWSRINAQVPQKAV